MFDATLAKVVPGGAGAPHVEPALPLPTIRRPFKLLDLPVDVLKEIIREVPHTNDLSALALTHSALNKLVIPQIYSRFDIVWPDATSTTDTRSGVDALTYGLDTLVKGRKVFFQPLSHLVWASHLRRRGNDYSQYTRKFSLGNGPSEWVQEYHMTKESGKMLNTLVTLAVAPMLNLESFTWDMPTGVVRDVWEALSSLADQPGGKSRLESVWLRCHSAKHAAHYHLGHSSTHGSFHHHHSHTHHQYHPPTSHSARDSELSALQKSYRRIESPNLSILPPMRKVALLDVDEIAYLDELSSLIGRSIDGLRELRLGVASTADPVLWFPSNQKDPAQSHGLAGGVLGFVFKSLYDCRQRTRLVNGTEKGGKASQLRVETPSSLITSDAGSSSEPPVAPTPVQPAPEPMPLSSQENAQQSLSNEVKVSQAAEQDNEQEELDLLDPAKEDGFSGETLSSTASKPPLRLVTGASIPHRSSSTANLRSAAAASRRSAPPSKRRKLQLDTLELANVPLYIGVLLRTVNWTRLTTLTLLNCRSDDDLWKALRRIHAPSSSVVAAEATDPANLDASRYTLQLRRIRTNGVTPALLAVLNETLAPDSLEWLFLQDRPAKTAGSTGNNGGSTANAGLQSGGGGGGGGGAVTVEQIYRGPLRRHRASLRKVMIDSGVVGGPGGSGLRGRDTQRWKRWMLPRDVLKFATSGKMKALRELAVSIDYEDWVSSSPLFSPSCSVLLLSSVFYISHDIHTFYYSITSSGGSPTSRTCAPCTSRTCTATRTARPPTRASWRCRWPTWWRCGRRSSCATWAC